MRKQLVLSLVVALSSAGVAHAEQTLAAGSLYGGPSQTRAVCYIFNAGPTVNIVFMDMYDQNGVTVPLDIRQCGGPLATGQSCGIAGNITNNSTYSCSANVTPGKTNVRGILEVRDANQNSLTNIELR